MTIYKAVVLDGNNTKDMPAGGELYGHISYSVQQSLSASQQAQALANIGAQAALGFTPTVNYSAGGSTPHTIGFAWDGASLRPQVDNNNVLGVLWGQTNLTAGQLGGILGYAPAQPTTVVSVSAGQSGTIAVGSNSAIAAVGFTATASSLRAVAACSAVSTAGGIQTNFTLQLVDTTANKTIATGPVSTVHAAIANGHCPVVAVLGASGLVVGNKHSLALYAGQVSSASAGSTQVGYVNIEGSNL